jgi:hypothetical protein
VDDHAVVRSGLGAFLSAYADLELTSKAVAFKYDAGTGGLTEIQTLSTLPAGTLTPAAETVLRLCWAQLRELPPCTEVAYTDFRVVMAMAALHRMPDCALSAACDELERLGAIFEEMIVDAARGMTPGLQLLLDAALRTLQAERGAVLTGEQGGWTVGASVGLPNAQPGSALGAADVPVRLTHAAPGAAQSGKVQGGAARPVRRRAGCLPRPRQSRCHV